MARPEAYTLTQNILNWFGTEKGLPSTVKNSGDKVPDVFALYTNYPNPFNPVTTIAYDLAKAKKVELAVYNVLGQKIRTLVNDNRSIGRHIAIWDGKDDAGVPVTSGIYFYKIVAGDFVKSHKMALVK